MAVGVVGGVVVGVLRVAGWFRVAGWVGGTGGLGGTCRHGESPRAWWLEGFLVGVLVCWLLVRCFPIGGWWSGLRRWCLLVVGVCSLSVGVGGLLVGWRLGLVVVAGGAMRSRRVRCWSWLLVLQAGEDV